MTLHMKSELNRSTQKDIPKTAKSSTRQETNSIEMHNKNIKNQTKNHLKVIIKSTTFKF